jgi:hypothetical protein
MPLVEWQKQLLTAGGFMTVEKLKLQIETLEEMLVNLKNRLAASEASEHSFKWDLLHECVGILTDEKQRYGWNHTVYAGFRTKKEAEAYVSRLKKSAQWCSENGKPAPYTSVEIRQAKRLLTSKWELKIADLNLSLLDKLLVSLAEPEELGVCAS